MVLSTCLSIVFNNVLDWFFLNVLFWDKTLVSSSNYLSLKKVVLGLADIMGRRFGSVKIPYNKQKSWAGSISMFVFGFLISIG